MKKQVMVNTVKGSRHVEQAKQCHLSVAGVLLLIYLTRGAALLFQLNASSGKRTGSRAAVR